MVPEIYALSMGKKTPSRRYAMRPIINVLEEDQATDTGNRHKKFGKDRTCASGDILADRQTDPETHILITILGNAPTGEVTTTKYCYNTNLKC